MEELQKDENSDEVSAEFINIKHVQYFLHHSKALPEEYIDADCNRMTLLYFVIVALDMLGKLHTLNADECIEFVYNQQLLASSDGEIVQHGHFGFIGSPFMGHNVDLPCSESKYEYLQGHLAMIYTALIVLITLDDDLSRVDKISIRKGLTLLQQSDGSFLSCLHGAEPDVRFVYCACAICSLLDMWDAIDKPSAVRYIISCMTYEGGFGLRPGGEAQGGSTYCAVAALFLMGELQIALSPLQLSTLTSWCERRQQEGFTGRTGKEPDSCYSFWIGGVMSMLGVFHDSDGSSTRAFVLNECQNDKYGGFSKLPDSYPDLMHSFYSLCWLSCDGVAAELNPLDVALGICKDRLEKFRDGKILK